jgi:hypothetical protein
VFINNFKQWADRADELENTGGNFGYRLFDEAEQNAPLEYGAGHPFGGKSGNTQPGDPQYQYADSSKAQWTASTKSVPNNAAGIPRDGNDANDVASFTHRFRNLTENAYYYLKYQVVSDVGASPWSDLRRVFVSQLPTKVGQVYGSKPGVEETTIAWTYDETRVGN